VFLGVTGFMMFYMVTNRPLQSLAGALTMLAGLVVFAITRGPAPARNPLASTEQ
jgi:basic amino acid/polyamine antiporter, APA family